MSGNGKLSAMDETEAASLLITKWAHPLAFDLPASPQLRRTEHVLWISSQRNVMHGMERKQKQVMARIRVLIDTNATAGPAKGAA